MPLPGEKNPLSLRQQGPGSRDSGGFRGTGTSGRGDRLPLGVHHLDGEVAEHVHRAPVPVDEHRAGRSRGFGHSVGRATTIGRKGAAPAAPGKRADRPGPRRAVGQSKWTSVGSPWMLSGSVRAKLCPEPPLNLAASAKITSPINARFSVLLPLPSLAVTSPSNSVVSVSGVRCLLLIDRKLFRPVMSMSVRPLNSEPGSWSSIAIVLRPPAVMRDVSPPTHTLSTVMESAPWPVSDTARSPRMSARLTVTPSCAPWPVMLRELAAASLNRAVLPTPLPR